MQDSAGIALKLWYVGEDTMIVLTNEEGGLFTKLMAAGHGIDNLYEVLEALQPYSSGAITDRFMQTLASNPAGSEIFTVTFSSWRTRLLPTATSCRNGPGGLFSSLLKREL